MRVTIVKEVSGYGVNVDGFRIDGLELAGLPEDFHALQWDGTGGELEYTPFRNDKGELHKKPNEPVTDLSPYQKHVDMWREAKAELDAKEAARKAKEAANAAG
jgi:hypothetical protein